MDRLGQKIESTLTLTVAYKVTDLFTANVPNSFDALRYLGITMLCSSLAHHALLGAVQPSPAQQGSRAGVALAQRTGLRLLNRVLIAAFLKLLVQQVSAASDMEGSQSSGYWQQWPSEASHHFSLRWKGAPGGENGGPWALLFGYLPISVWPKADNFLASLMVVVVAGTVYKIVHRLTVAFLAAPGVAAVGGSSANGPLLDDELQQVVRSLQYAFADTATTLLSEPRASVVLAVAGVTCLPLLKNLQEGGASLVLGGTQTGTRSLIVGGLSMAWINVIVGVLTSRSSEGLDIGLSGIVTNSVTSLAVALLFQSTCNIIPGTDILQGYLEWNVANSVSASVQAWGSRKGLLYLGLMASATAAAAPQVGQLWDLATGGHGQGAPQPSPSAEKGSPARPVVSTQDTVVHVATTVAVNSVTKYVVDAVTGQSVLDTVTVTVAGIILVRKALSIYNTMRW